MTICTASQLDPHSKTLSTITAKPVLNAAVRFAQYPCGVTQLDSEALNDVTLGVPLQVFETREL